MPSACYPLINNGQMDRCPAFDGAEYCFGEFHVFHALIEGRFGGFAGFDHVDEISLNCPLAHVGCGDIQFLQCAIAGLGTQYSLLVQNGGGFVDECAVRTVNFNGFTRRVMRGAWRRDRPQLRRFPFAPGYLRCLGGQLVPCRLL